jgi:hypothetical protein
MDARTRVLVVPAVLVLGAVVFAAVLTPCISRVSANPGQNGPEAGAGKRAPTRPCPGVRKT